MYYVKREINDVTRMYAIEKPVFIRRERNGVLLRCDWGNQAQGVMSPNEAEIWQLAGRKPLGEEYPVVEQVTLAEYEEWAYTHQFPDPEDEEPEIPEGMEPDKVLTRGELTQKVEELEDQLSAARILLGVKE